MNIDELSRFFKALSEPVRLRLVALLWDSGELCVCDFVEVLQLPQSVVSRHLAYLRQRQVLEARREGVWMHYRLCKESPLVASLEKFFSDHALLSQDFHNDRVRLSVIQKNGASMCQGS